MAQILNMSRGGMGKFKCMFCDGDWSEYGPPYTMPNMPNTPPFDSHADGAYGQGYLNLQFPFVPHLDGHEWMRNALRGIREVGDVFFTNWVPSRHYVTSVYYEVRRTDKMLEDVYLQPVAYRFKPDLPTYPRQPGSACCLGELTGTYEPIEAFTTELNTAGIDKFPLGKPKDDDKLYGMALLATDAAQLPSTFGHNILRKKADNSVEPIDEYFGEVLLGYKVVQGDAEKIASIGFAHCAVYFSGKLIGFECASQVG